MNTEAREGEGQTIGEGRSKQQGHSVKRLKRRSFSARETIGTYRVVDNQENTLDKCIVS